MLLPLILFFVVNCEDMPVRNYNQGGKSCPRICKFSVIFQPALEHIWGASPALQRHSAEFTTSTTYNYTGSGPEQVKGPFQLSSVFSLRLFVSVWGSSRGWVTSPGAAASYPSLELERPLGTTHVPIRCHCLQCTLCNTTYDTMHYDTYIRNYIRCHWVQPNV